MVYNYYFDIAGIVLNLTLICLAFFRKNFPSKKVSIYRVMLVSHLIATILDIVTTYSMSYPERYSLTFNYVMIIMYYLIHNLTGIIFVVYSLASEKDIPNIDVAYRVWLWVAIIELVLIVTTPFTKFVFYFDKNMAYKHGLGLYLLYLAGIAMVVYVVYLKFKNKERNSSFQLISNVIYAIALPASFLFNLLIRPDILIELFAIDVAFFVMYIAQDNPESYLYKGIAVYNRNAFDDRLSDLIKEDEPFEVLFITVDDSENYFKNNNILFAHEKEIITKLTHGLNIKDNLFVITDLCFAIFCKGDSKEYINKTNNLILDESYNFIYGLMEYPKVISNYDEAIIVIDDLLYKLSNHVGKDVIVANRKVIGISRTKDIEKLIKKALNNHTIEFMYDPILDAKTNKAYSVEFKPILRDEDDKIIDYKDIYRIAENEGVIDKVDLLVLVEATNIFEKENFTYYGTGHISINMSPISLLNSEFIYSVKEIVKVNKINCSKVFIEIPNLGVIDNKSLILDRIDELVKMGFMINLDNFGNGQIDYSLLAKLPLSAIKIDRELVKEVENNKKSRAILENSLKLIKDLKILSICNGIEDFTQSTIVEKKCDYVQGPYYSKSLLIGDYIEFLKNQFNATIQDINNR